MDHSMTDVAATTGGQQQSAQTAVSAQQPADWSHPVKPTMSQTGAPSTHAAMQQQSGGGGGGGGVSAPGGVTVPSVGSGVVPATSAAALAAHQAQQQQVYERWQVWMQGVESTDPRTQHRSLDHLFDLVSQSQKYGNYLLSKLKVLDRIVPLLTAAVRAMTVQGGPPPDLFVLERCASIIASCSYQQWEDRHKSALLSTYPGLLDALVALLQRAEPNVAAQCGRALWNLSYRNEVVKSNTAVQSLLPRLVSHLSSKHVKLKQFSIGLLWSLCDSQPATCVEVVGTHDGMRIILQGLTNANSAGGSSDSETYFLLISLLNTLLNNDSTLRAKSIAVSCNVSGILLPLLLRTTSTTLMDRICEVLSTVLFMQSKEQHLFASQGGLKALVDAIQKPALSKCLQRLSLAFLAAVYRSRTWIMTGVSAATPPAELAAMQAAREKLESEVEPAFAHLAALFREWQEKNPCTTMCLAVGLTLACLAQNKPRFLRLLLQSNTLPALLRFLTPPQHYSVHDQNKVKEIGLGLLLQVAQSSTEVQRFLCTASPPPSAPLPVAPGSTAAPAPGVVVDPAANGVYGAYFQSLIDCIKIEKLRPATARLVACIVEPAACRPAARLLMSGHAGFVAQLLQGLKQSFPNPLKPAHADRDLTPHAQLCGCLFVLAGGVPPANANQQQPQPQPPAVDPDEVNRNFTYLTQLILTDKQVADVLSRLSSFVRQAQQAQQQQALAQQQQQQQQQQQINSVNSAMHSLKPSPPPIPPPAMQQQPPVQQQQPVSHSQGQHSYPQQGSSQQQQHSQYSSRGGSGGAQPVYHSQQPSSGPVAHVSSSAYNSAVQSGSAHGAMQQQSARPYAQQQQQQQVPQQQKQMQPVYAQPQQQSVQSSPPAYHPSTQQSLPPQGYANPVPNPKASPTAQELLQMAYARR